MLASGLRRAALLAALGVLALPGGAGAGQTPAAPGPASWSGLGLTASLASAGKRNAAARKARRRAVRKCRTIKRTVRRKACVRRVNRRFVRRIRSARPAKPPQEDPVQPTGVEHHVDVHDDFFSPGRLSINKGDAIVWTWNEMNHNPHNITLLEGPPGVSPLDFERGTAPGVGATFRRVFRVPGGYRLACSLHHLMILDVEVSK